ncbi:MULTISPECIES: hypothetical protein [unclassified Luteibacter]|uniref:hypothetical protein n=1 Tax=unclassified Luteibacter TaxID=2620188 RepID=UPI0005BDC375|nr:MULTISPECIES: hypothetical protein [unclassified Luteibacter]MDR6641606.1 hypothetical protein [Luteibacter sp. 1214]
MIVFVLTLEGWDRWRHVAAGHASIWLNGGVADPAEVSELRRQGLDLTIMTRRLDPLDGAGIDDELVTIREHFPGHVLFIERSES